MVDGVFRTTLFIDCEAAVGAGTVTAIVNGASSAATSGAFTVVTSATDNPCA
jgi:hypothetical protein